MAVRESVKALADLGFTNLEAEIYAFLLQESPATGYRVAQSIGKPAANTYKAIQTLEQKGAVIVEDGTSRMCRAISPDELLSRLGREFELKRTSAHQSLSSLNHLTPDERIYQVRSRDQILQRVREMLGEAKQVVLAIVDGSMIHMFADDFLAAAAKGVDVAVISDQSARIEGVELVIESKESLAKTTLQIVVDGEQTLVAHFDSTGALSSAIWSRNPMLAVTHHDGLANRICLSNLASRIEEGAGPKRIARTLASLRHASTTAGFARLKG
ncbi:MAG: helix-turn-helix domain-containing protein [Fimbriimonas sp.]|nr:helix-turn-helix domain-containing protein [Fimbriimonas sp.]